MGSFFLRGLSLRIPGGRRALLLLVYLADFQSWALPDRTVSYRGLAIGIGPPEFTPCIFIERNPLPHYYSEKKLNSIIVKNFLLRLLK